MTSTGRNIFNNETIIGVGQRLQNLQNANVAQDKVAIFKLNNDVETTNISSYGRQLLNETSFASFRTSILEGTEEAIKYTSGDNVYEILFHTNTGGTPSSSNLRFKITDTTASLENDLALNCNDINVNPNRSILASYVGSAVGQNLNLRYGNSVYQEFNSSGININENVVMANNKFIKMKIEDSGSRVLVESEAKLQYCLYSYEENTNSGLLVQARLIGNDDIMEINNYRNSDNTHQPISINRTITSSSYVVIGAGINPTNITSADFVSNGQSIFCNGASVLLDVNSTNIQPYKNIIPSGSLDIGATATRFNNIYNNISTITNEIRLNTFSPVAGDYRQKGIFFREGYNGLSNGDNMCIRSVERTDFSTIPPSTAGDRMLISSYGGVSINYLSNNTGNNGATSRIALFHDQITIHKDMVGNQDGAVSLGTASLKYNEIYGNNIRAHTSLYSSHIRPYSGTSVRFHNSSITLDATYSLDVDTVRSTGNNRDLVLSTGETSRVALLNTGGIVLETTIYPSVTNQQSVGTSSNKFQLGYINSVWSDAVLGNNTLELYGGSQRHMTLGNGGGTFILIDTGLRPNNSTVDIGGSESSSRFRNLYLEENAYLTNLKPIGTNSSVRCGAHYYPELNNTYDLGGSPSGIDRLWREVYSTNSAINTSDRRKKKDIVEIDTKEALDTINRLKPVKYKWKENQSNRTHIGYIAQDVLSSNVLGLKDNFAGYVKTESGSLALRYGEFISLNTSAIQHLDKKINKLASGNLSTSSLDTIVEYDDKEVKNEIENLKEENEKLHDLVVDLEGEVNSLKEENNSLNDRLDNLTNFTKEAILLIEEKFKELNSSNVSMNIIEDTDDGEENIYDVINSKIVDVEKQVLKLDNKVKKLTTGYNKIVKKLP